MTYILAKGMSRQNGWRYMLREQTIDESITDQYIQGRMFMDAVNSDPEVPKSLNLAFNLDNVAT